MDLTSPTINKSGKSRSKSDAAAEEAQHMIDVMLAPKGNDNLCGAFPPIDSKASSGELLAFPR
jgi:hypothetical protein